MKPLVYVIRNSLKKTSNNDVVKHPRRFQIFHDTCHFIKLCTKVELNFLITQLKSREDVLLKYKLDFYEWQTSSRVLGNVFPSSLQFC